MENSWRINAISVTKYNPIYLKDGRFSNDEWIGFFQIGKKFKGTTLTFSDYKETENSYIKAALLFLEFHNCNEVVIRNLEKNNFEKENYDDYPEFNRVYNIIKEGDTITENELKILIGLNLRGIIWCEIVCKNDPACVIRFGYDFYMYFNTNQELLALKSQIENLNLFII